MIAPAELERIASEAGDEVFPGVWMSSRTALYAAALDTYNDLADDPSPEAAEVRAEVASLMFSLLDEIERQKRGGR